MNATMESHDNCNTDNINMDSAAEIDTVSVVKLNEAKNGTYCSQLFSLFNFKLKQIVIMRL